MAASRAIPAAQHLLHYVQTTPVTARRHAKRLLLWLAAVLLGAGASQLALHRWAVPRPFIQKHRIVLADLRGTRATLESSALGFAFFWQAPPTKFEVSRVNLTLTRAGTDALIFHQDRATSFSPQVPNTGFGFRSIQEVARRSGMKIYEREAMDISILCGTMTNGDDPLSWVRKEDISENRTWVEQPDPSVWRGPQPPVPKPLDLSLKFGFALLFIGGTPRALLLGHKRR